jgi:hypothetical protein
MSPGRGCVLSLALALFVGAGLLLLAVLAIQGEVRLGGGDPPAIRVWLVTEDENQGFGISTTRRFFESQGPQPYCLRTNVRLLLWKSDGSVGNLRYCECSSSETGGWQDVDCSSIRP